MFARRGFLFGSLVLLAGCGPQAPTYQDPLADISRARGADVAIDRPVQAGPTTAVTFGSNVERWLKYYDEGNKYAASVGVGPKLLADANPQNIVNGAVAVLRRRYPNIKAVNDLASAAREGIATTFVIDLASKWGMYPGAETTCDITIIAVDTRQQPISRIQAHGVMIIQPFVTPNPLEAPQKALADLDAKAQRLLN